MERFGQSEGNLDTQLGHFDGIVGAVFVREEASKTLQDLGGVLAEHAVGRDNKGVKGFTARGTNGVAFGSFLPGLGGQGFHGVLGAESGAVEAGDTDVKDGRGAFLIEVPNGEIAAPVGGWVRGGCRGRGRGSCRSRGHGGDFRRMGRRGRGDQANRGGSADGRGRSIHGEPEGQSGSSTDMEGRLQGDSCGAGGLNGQGSQLVPGFIVAEDDEATKGAFQRMGKAVGLLAAIANMGKVDRSEAKPNQQIVTELLRREHSAEVEIGQNGQPGAGELLTGQSALLRGSESGAMGGECLAAGEGRATLGIETAIFDGLAVVRGTKGTRIRGSPVIRRILGWWDWCVSGIEESSSEFHGNFTASLQVERGACGGIRESQASGLEGQGCELPGGKAGVVMGQAVQGWDEVQGQLSLKGLKGRGRTGTGALGVDPLKLQGFAESNAGRLGAVGGSITEGGNVGSPLVDFGGEPRIKGVGGAHKASQKTVAGDDG